MRGVAYAPWLSVAGLVVAVACGGSSDDDLFGNSGGSAGSTAGSSGAGGTGGGTGGSSGDDSGLGGGPSGAGGGGNAGAGNGGSAGSAGSAGAAGSGGEEGYTLENVCKKFPAATCSQRQDCCNKSGIGFSESACIAHETSTCNALVEQVNAGSRTFHADKIEACLAGLEPLLTACLFSGDQYVSYFKTINACLGIFESQNGPGTPCTTSFDCAPSTQPAGFAGCGQNGQCYQLTFAQAGEGCGNAYCDEGLTCTYPGGSPVCAPKVAQGSQCTTSSQCGWGFYCPQVSGPEVCQPAQPGGSGCNSDLHCLSLDCSGFQCTQQSPYVEPSDCGM
jgi:hypothetical protein